MSSTVSNVGLQKVDWPNKEPPNTATASTNAFAWPVIIVVFVVVRRFYPPFNASLSIIIRSFTREDAAVHTSALDVYLVQKKPLGWTGDNRSTSKQWMVLRWNTVWSLLSIILSNPNLNAWARPKELDLVSGMVKLWRYDTTIYIGIPSMNK